MFRGKKYQESAKLIDKAAEQEQAAAAAEQVKA